MSHLRQVCGAFLLLSILGGLASDHGNPENNSLVGCEWFGQDDETKCTTSRDNDTEPHDLCNFRGRQYQALGMKRVEKAKDDMATPDDLLWTQASAFGDAPEEIIEDFYLSRPNDGRYKSSNLCAALLVQQFPRMKFPGFDEDPASSTGTCEDAIGESCVQAILKLATDVVMNATYPDPCQTLIYGGLVNYMLRTYGGVIPGCSNNETDKYFDLGETFSSNINLNSSLPNLNPAQEEHGSCYPSFWKPGNSSIAVIGDKDKHEQMWVKTTKKTLFKNAYAITPALLVSWIDPGEEGNPTDSRLVGSTLTCLKIVDTNHSVNASLQTRVDSKGKKGSEGTFHVTTPNLTTILLVWVALTAVLY